MKCYCTKWGVINGGSDGDGLMMPNAGYFGSHPNCCGDHGDELSYEESVYCGPVVSSIERDYSGVFAIDEGDKCDPIFGHDGLSIETNQRVALEVWHGLGSESCPKHQCVRKIGGGSILSGLAECQTYQCSRLAIWIKCFMLFSKQRAGALMHIVQG
uniref:Uncharacterized protein n=1 Tax=Romanomermis culicivorax TaxID=13658 RepID=A0A915HU08_ROMCU